MNGKTLSKLIAKGLLSPCFIRAVDLRKAGASYRDIKSVYGNEASAITANDARDYMVGELLHAVRTGGYGNCSRREAMEFLNSLRRKA